jgi:hypothetical protein
MREGNKFEEGSTTELKPESEIIAPAQRSGPHKDQNTSHPLVFRPKPAKNFSTMPKYAGLTVTPRQPTKPTPKNEFRVDNFSGDLTVPVDWLPTENGSWMTTVQPRSLPPRGAKMG